MSRLSWNDLDLDAGTLMISAAASKVRHRRIVHLQPACAAWLRKGGDLSGLKNLRRRPEAIRGAADIKAWPHDVLRHAAASHLVPLVGTGKAVEMLGNSESILHRHYRDLVKPQDNARFWSILPAGSKQESRVA